MDLRKGEEKSSPADYFDENALKSAFMIENVEEYCQREFTPPEAYAIERLQNLYYVEKDVLSPASLNKIINLDATIGDSKEVERKQTSEKQDVPHNLASIKNRKINDYNMDKNSKANRKNSKLSHHQKYRHGMPTRKNSMFSTQKNPQKKWSIAFSKSSSSGSSTSVDKRNARERTRVHTVNQAFFFLKQQLPTLRANTKRVSKLKILRAAVTYIHSLDILLRDPSSLKSSFKTEKILSENSTNMNYCFSNYENLSGTQLLSTNNPCIENILHANTNETLLFPKSINLFQNIGSTVPTCQALHTSVSNYMLDSTLYANFPAAINLF